MIELSNVSFGYGDSPLYSDLSINFQFGGCYGLLGLNGAGKTSLIKLVAGALFPDAGTIRVLDRNPGQRQAEHLVDICFVAEKPVAPAVSVDRWLAQQLCFRPAFQETCFHELLKQFDLTEIDRLKTLSFGQLKKFSLAAAFSSGAKVLLLDEPTNGLDIPGKIAFRKMLSAMAGPEHIIVISTHQVRDLENLLDPLVLINAGKLLCNISQEELAAGFSTGHLADLTGQPVVFARRVSCGYSALLARPGELLDLELFFEAAIHSPERFQAAVHGEALAEYQDTEELQS
ncbi:MAG: ABC transporter ATP-binding protein [Spirochaetes bacterium]|nr:ABC transporter ATP-binding protein [Spirochaetota bacterium]